MMLAPIDTADRVYSITPSAMSVGAVSSLPGFRLGSGVTLGVRNETEYGATAKVFGFNSGYLGAGNFTEPLFETVASGRDVVVTTWSRVGTLYLRCNRAKGRGLKITWSGQTSGGQMRISYAKNIPASLSSFLPSDSIGTTDLFQTSNMPDYVTGWNTSSTAGDEYEFSLIGSVLTAKWNGQTVYTADDVWFIPDGSVVYGPSISEGAIRDTTITFKPSAGTYTDFDNRVIDLRDWNWKDSQTTGSMAEGSYDITGVADVSQFAVGDPIVVEIGGEAGAGLKGTIGVGGTWPATRVANYAALPDAATYRAANGGTDCWIWVISENATYVNYLNAGVPTWGEWTNYIQSDVLRNRAFYHTTKLLPRALKANIVSIVGNTITVDTASEAATSNANIYYDCSDIITPALCNRFTNASTGFADISATESWDILFPPGKFCVTKDQVLPLGDRWRVMGSGAGRTTLYSPKGTEQVALKMSGESHVFSDLKIQAWAGINYWCTDSANGYIEQAKYAIQDSNGYKSNCVIERIICENTWGGPTFNTRFDSVMRFCKGIHNNGGIQQYATWFFGQAYCTNTWIEDCEYYSPCVSPGFEIFQADGGGFRRIKSYLGYVASNTSGNSWLMEDMDIHIDLNFKPEENDWIIEDSPIININTNIGIGAYNPSLANSGGTIRNVNITSINSPTTGVFMTGISIQLLCAYVTIEGTHPDKPGNGVINMIDCLNGAGADTRGARGIVSDGSITVVRGIRVIGDARGEEFANISLRNPDGTIEDCVADKIARFNGSAHASLVGSNGNMTNAEYEALP